MSTLLAPIFEGSAAAIMVNGFMQMQALPIDAVMRNQYGGHSQYLTLQGCVGDFVHFISSNFELTNAYAHD